MSTAEDVAASGGKLDQAKALAKALSTWAERCEAGYPDVRRGG